MDTVTLLGDRPCRSQLPASWSTPAAVVRMLYFVMHGMEQTQVRNVQVTIDGRSYCLVVPEGLDGPLVCFYDDLEEEEEEAAGPDDDLFPDHLFETLVEVGSGSDSDSDSGSEK